MNEEFVYRMGVLRVKYDLTYDSLGNLLNVSRDTAGNYLTGRTEMPRKRVEKLASILGFDKNWLLTGVGTHPDNEDGRNNITQAGESQISYGKASAGLGPVVHQDSQIRQLVASSIENFPHGEYRIWEVEGMSMYPSLSQGDKLLCRSVGVEEIIDNRLYVIVINNKELSEYRSSGVWVKRLLHRKENGYITCKSDNKDTAEPYPTFRLKTKELVSVWYPVMRITYNMSDPNRDLYDRIDELEGRIEMIESLMDENNL